MKKSNEFERIWMNWIYTKVESMNKLETNMRNLRVKRPKCRLKIALVSFFVCIVLLIIGIFISLENFSSNHDAKIYGGECNSFASMRELMILKLLKFKVEMISNHETHKQTWELLIDKLRSLHCLNYQNEIYDLLIIFITHYQSLSPYLKYNYIDYLHGNI